MTQHITQKVAVALSIEAGDEFAIHQAEFYTNLCNAAIQHYLDQHKAELPVLPDWEASGLWDALLAWSHSDIDRCDALADNAEEIINAQLQAYGQQCAAHARKLAQEQSCPECHCHFVGSDVTAPGSTRLVNTAPQAQPVAQPLTDDAIQRIYIETHQNGFSGRNLETEFARAIEAAHGITEKASGQ